MNKQTLGLLATMIFSGCGEFYNGFEIKASSSEQNVIHVFDRTAVAPVYNLSAWDRNQDGIFEEIDVNAPKHHRLWEYANQDSLRKAYELAMKNQ